MATSAALTLMSHADKIPDHLFHRVPGGFFCPPDEKEKFGHKVRDKDRRRMSKTDSRDTSSSRNDSKSRNDSDSRTESKSRGSRSRKSEQSRDSQPQRRPRPERNRGSSYLGRGYESDDGPQSHHQTKSNSTYYFPPPPTEALDADGLVKPNKPYSPEHYNAAPGSRDLYYSDHPEQHREYSPAIYQPEPPGLEGRPHVDTDLNYRGNRSMKEYGSGAYGEDRASNYSPAPYDRHGPRSERKYTPAAYSSSRRGSQRTYASAAPPPPNHGSYASAAPPIAAGYAAGAAASHASSNPYVQYVPEDNRSKRSGSKSRTRSRGRSDEDRPSRGRRSSRSRSSQGSHRSQSRPSRSKSRGSEKRAPSRGRSTSRIRHELSTALKDRKEIAGAAIGAIAGGLIAHKAGHGDSLATIVGAALGSLGGMVGEKKWEEEKEAKRRARGDYVGQGRGRYDSRNGGDSDRGRRRDGYYSS